MNADVTPYLRCPVCGGRLSGGASPGAAGTGPPAPRPLRCPRGHSFDLARQGYVHLGAGRAPRTGDTAEMVAARSAFLDAGHYGFLSAALAEAASGWPGGARDVPRGPDGSPPPLVVDVGAGTGHHLAAVLDALPGAVGLALDAAKPAVRRAARAHPRAAAALCDTWARLPLGDAETALLLNVFAPRNGPEFHRVLRPDGLLLVVIPGPDHLTELVDALGLLRVDPEKPARVAAGLGAGFRSTGETPLRRTLPLDRTAVGALVGMGPSAWHTSPERLARLVAELPERIEVTASFRLCRYRTEPP